MSEDEKQIEFHRQKIKSLSAEVKEKSGQLNWHRRQLEELDEEYQKKRKRSQAALRAKQMKVMQDRVVEAIRRVGKPCTAGPICTQLKKMGYELKHGSTDFAATYIDAVKRDPRVVIEEVNSTKFKYALREWGPYRKI